jgi:hypothetical protein
MADKAVRAETPCSQQHLVAKVAFHLAEMVLPSRHIFIVAPEASLLAEDMGDPCLKGCCASFFGVDRVIVVISRTFDIQYFRFWLQTMLRAHLSALSVLRPQATHAVAA